MTNENDSDEVRHKKWDYRVKHWEDVVTQQFQLAYFGRISYSDSQSMPIQEREFIFSKLIDQKKLEKNTADKLAKEAQAKRSSSSSHHRRR